MTDFSDALKAKLSEMEERIHYRFQKAELLLLAMTHRSYYNEHRAELSSYNERLEFLGDSVLGLVVASLLYEWLPEAPEGRLSHLRSLLVDASSCARYAEKLGLTKYVLLGRGERMSEGRGRETIAADLFEALVGAIYLDGGLDAVKSFFHSALLEDLKALMEEPPQNWKALLQDLLQKRSQQLPIYRVMGESGPEHGKLFEVAVFRGEEELGRGVGPSKKQAEVEAARIACSKFTEGTDG